MHAIDTNSKLVCWSTLQNENHNIDKKKLDYEKYASKRLDFAKTDLFTGTSDVCAKTFIAD
jgi:hypothetical protein